MTRVVIDAPTLLHVVATDLVIDPGHRIVAPGGIRSQALTLLLGAVQRGELSEATAMVHHEAMTALKIRLLSDRVSRRTAWRIAREHGWDTLTDAEYLAVTQLQADVLVTVDPAMAARADGIVEVRPVETLTAPAH